jgi:putative acyl-CoA dehydrogenase
MGMTEKQGGSDVRANQTTASPVAGTDEEYRLTGHKWFCSAPMSDLFLVLAQAPGGLTCFAVPRVLPDGSRNVWRIQRLKDKLGDRSNASSEIELAGTTAWRVGDEGRGVPTIIEMVNHTRLDCILGSTAVYRLGTALALHHTSERSAFGKRLSEQPLMQQVLADLAVESEAATVTAMRLARAYDVAAQGPDTPGYEHERLLQRLATPVVKYWVCKRAPSHAVEALECHGGNGYVEESVLPRLFRQSPLNGIWEGSGNVICLDVLRAMGRSPEAVEAFFDELALAAGADSRLDAAVDRLGKELGDLDDIERRARRVVEAMALAFQGSLLVRFGDPAAADAFCRTRLDGDWGHAFGSLPPGADTARITARAEVRLAD